MAIDITNSQGTKVYLCAAGTTVTTAANCVTAIAAGKQIGCIQDLGALNTSRSVQEYSCLSSDEIAKSFGSLKLGNLTVGMIFNSLDAAGQAELKTMFSTNTKRVAIIVLNDQVTPATGNPTYITFDAGVSSTEVSITKDNAVMINATVEVASVPVTIPKV